MDGILYLFKYKYIQSDVISNGGSAQASYVSAHGPLFIHLFEAHHRSDKATARDE